MKKISVLDVTLRDGGCVINFNFGQYYMNKILSAQEDSGVDIIELGYLDNNNGSAEGRTQYNNEKVITSAILKRKKEKIKYVAMMDYGQFNVDSLQDRTNDGIDGIRLAFHKKNRLDIVSLGKKIISKGYDFYIQPMITLRYSDSELLELIELVNHELPNASGFYIVDSFGEMRPNDMSRILNLVDHNLIPSMTVGFHSHNNLQMSYSNAVAMLQFPTNRDIILDSSIMGMGKGAGNLNTELLLEHLNLYYGKHYSIAPLLEVMDKVINQIHAEYYWGYSPEYYLSSANHCTPSYASHFYNKHMLPIDQVGELLSLIDEDKKISFDKEYAERMYVKYNSQKVVDDSEATAQLLDVLSGKDVLIIAPGKSIISYHETLKKIQEKSSLITISLNMVEEFDQDYVITTRKDVFDRAVEEQRNVIVSSNIAKASRGNVIVLNYENWIELESGTHDSSSIIAFKLMEMADIRQVYLAGFDGFSVGINDNYYNPYMRVPVLEEQAISRNNFFTKRIQKMRENGIDIKFVTPSKYQKEGSILWEN